MHRVLVVEDDPAAQLFLRRMFKRARFAVETATDGLSGLELFRTSEPSVVVLDLGLPKMHGRDVCHRLKSAAPLVPVIIVSGATAVEDKVQLLKMGADDYMTKPFDPSELLARVRALLRRPGARPEAITDTSISHSL
jgi:DNA-binding response OmpR family regulator